RREAIPPTRGCSRASDSTPIHAVRRWSRAERDPAFRPALSQLYKSMNHAPRAVPARTAGIAMLLLLFRMLLFHNSIFDHNCLKRCGELSPKIQLNSIGKKCRGKTA
ncbi:MAG: hypothetical protein V4564_05975, partial [Pseudomonadota bacterium]